MEIHLRLDPRTAERLARLAEKEGRTRQNYIRRLIDLAGQAPPATR